MQHVENSMVLGDYYDDESPIPEDQVIVCDGCQAEYCEAELGEHIFINFAMDGVFCAECVTKWEEE